MLGEVDILGGFMPRAVTWFVVALLIFATADWCLTKTSFYKHFWHPSLVRFGLFICLFCAGGWLASAH
jgi:protein AaeX